MRAQSQSQYQLNEDVQKQIRLYQQQENIKVKSFEVTRRGSKNEQNFNRDKKLDKRQVQKLTGIQDDLDREIQVDIDNENKNQQSNVNHEQVSAWGSTQQDFNLLYLQQSKNKAKVSKFKTQKQSQQLNEDHYIPLNETISVQIKNINSDSCKVDYKDMSHLQTQNQSNNIQNLSYQYHLVDQQLKARNTRLVIYNTLNNNQKNKISNLLSCYARDKDQRQTMNQDIFEFQQDIKFSNDLNKSELLLNLTQDKSSQRSQQLTFDQKMLNQSQSYQSTVNKNELFKRIHKKEQDVVLISHKIIKSILQNEGQQNQQSLRNNGFNKNESTMKSVDHQNGLFEKLINNLKKERFNQSLIFNSQNKKEQRFSKSKRDSNRLIYQSLQQQSTSNQIQEYDNYIPFKVKEKQQNHSITRYVGYSKKGTAFNRQQSTRENMTNQTTAVSSQQNRGYQNFEKLNLSQSQTDPISLPRIYRKTSDNQTQDTSSKTFLQNQLLKNSSMLNQSQRLITSTRENIRDQKTDFKKNYALEQPYIQNKKNAYHLSKLVNKL